MKIVQFAANLLRQKDVLLVVVFALVLLMMILPLPALLMDMLITFNISASIIILLMSLQVHTPVQFSTFPSLLLVTTLFRLAISISTTRLILIEGNAGQIVETFGQVVVGGNLIVGLVIFLIITVVQFLVITKGADRVAEVGARFTLDGMPGKQMSVDADVRAGNIDQFDAREARQNLEREAKLFGSMDGAMKFVKGDATAGLVITAINLLGGILIGMAQQGFSFSDALQLYALLTVGDGLVAQIPALLISVAAGNMVTRVVSPKGSDLGTEIGQQLTDRSRTIIIAGLFIGLFGFIPGFPTVIFLLVGASLAGGVLWALRKRSRAVVKAESDWPSKLRQIDQQCAELEARTGAKEGVRMVLPGAMRAIPVAYLCGALDNLKQRLWEEFGISSGLWRIEFDASGTEDYRIFVKQELAATGLYRAGTLFVKANPSYLAAFDIPHVADFGVREGCLVAETEMARLRQEKIEYWTPVEQFLLHLKKTIIENLHRMAGLQGVAEMLDEAQRSNPVLVGELRDGLSNNQISAVLKMMLRERLPIVSRIRILETMLQWSQVNPDPAYLLQKVRAQIADVITHRFAAGGFLPVVVVAPSLESCIREGLRNTGEGSFLVLEPSVSAYLAQKARDMAGDGFKLGRDPVLITQQDIRQALYTMLQEHGIYVPVLAYQEITPETTIYPVDYLAIDTADAA